MLNVDSVSTGHRLNLGSGIELSFRFIQAGNFPMGARGEWGDEEPIHLVQITEPFYMGTFPVTQEQFAIWKPSHENGFPNKATHPAERVTWHEANEFCDWLTQNFRSDFPSGCVAAGLPTEAQWEYACRAETDTEYHTGDGEAALKLAGWYEANASGSTQPVGMLAPNKFGLYDMHGNVWEWCRDAWDAEAYKRRCDGVRDPEMKSSDDDAGRVFRGGCWVNSPRNCRAAYRFWRSPGSRNRGQGFRVCLFPGPTELVAEP